MPARIDPLVEVAIPVGGRSLVVADLHLTTDTGGGRTAPVAELTQAVAAWSGPGVLVFAGNTFDPAAALDTTPAAKPGQAGASVAAILDAHPRLTAAVREFAGGAGRRVVLLPGDRDIQLASSDKERQRVATALGAHVALSAELAIDTGAGVRRVRVEAGQNLDSLTEFTDPTNQGESPLAQHLRAELFPAVLRSNGTDGDWLSGLEKLDDLATFPRFLASRLVYRKLGRRAWLLLVPVAVAVILRLPTLAVSHATGLVHTPLGRAWILALITGIELVLLAGLAVASLRRTWRALAGLALGEADREPNRAARDLARQLIADGYHGLVTGHTCRPELTNLGVGFYANAGCGAEVVTEVPARLPGLGLPPVFVAHRSASWVELEAGNELHVRLLHADVATGGQTLLERIVACRRPEAATGKDLHPLVVATFPQGESWPRQPSGQLRKRRIRRTAAAFVFLAGFVSLISALSDPLRDRLHTIREVFPIAVPETAAALAAFAGVGLLVLARGIRRGQRRAWAVTTVLLLVVAVLDLVKGVDFEEAIVALAVAGFLWVNRAEFTAATDTLPLRGGLAIWSGVASATIVAGACGLEAGSALGGVAVRVFRHGVRRRHHFKISWWHAFEATVGRMVGYDTVALPRAIDRFFAPAMLTATFGLLLTLLILVFRPVVARRRRQQSGLAEDGGLARARAIFDRHGSGTLDYFALRPDKQFWFWGDTVVAYAVYGGVCLVSPDPIGPVAEREPAWRSFRGYVDEHGWALGGLGVGEDWLPIYRATGMHDLYAGDEGVVRASRFTLDGGKFKSLRQAVNRVAKHGYTISFHDPSRLEPALRDALNEVMTKSRRGDVERGFSMTLGRVFEPDDAGLLLAVVHGPPAPGAPAGEAGAPVAFCQYVPAPGIDGYSLDLMRRDDGEHPNGLIDFAVVETIKHLKAAGGDGLGLNFATMRAVLAGEGAERPSQRIQAWLLRRMGDSMQIESLWKFNAKFDPDWQPRYAIYDAPENLFAVAVAIARAESFWELPVVGRFLVPSSTAGAECEPAETIRPAATEPTPPTAAPEAPAPLVPAGAAAPGPSAGREVAAATARVATRAPAAGRPVPDRPVPERPAGRRSPGAPPS